MTSQELLLQAITNGLEDDGTTSAALDAIREESGCTLLAAVLEVARVHSASKAARTLTEATSFLAEGSPIRDELRASIQAECADVPTRAFFVVVVENGDQWPRSVRNSQFSDGEWVYGWQISVGAEWVKREANSIMIQREREEANKRFHRKGTARGRAKGGAA